MFVLVTCWAIKFILIPIGPILRDSGQLLTAGRGSKKTKTGFSVFFPTFIVYKNINRIHKKLYDIALCVLEKERERESKNTTQERLLSSTLVKKTRLESVQRQ